ncbi:MAG: response regulator [Dorea sp.]
MIRTIIVDDDFLVRAYLKQLGAWEKAGYEIVADLRDGEEALKAAEELGPDLIITDISMPLMDGIELIRRIREQNQSVYIIVLSCHDDFEYVKEAMKLGADEYVLKNSLNEDSLYEMLENTGRHMESRRAKYQETDRSKRLMEMGRHALKYHYFNGLLTGSFTEVEREEKKREAGIRASYINSAVISMCVPEWGNLKYRCSQVELEQFGQRFLQKLLKELKIREEDADSLECVYLGEGVFCCFIDLSDLRRSSVMKQRLTSVAATCFRCCKEETILMEVGVSNICFGEEGIRQAYQQAREMLKLGFYMDGTILYYEESPESEKVLPEEAKDFLEDARMLADRQEYDAFCRRFACVKESFERRYTDYRLVIRWIRELDQKLLVERSQEEYAGICKIGQLSDLCEDYHQKLFLEKRKILPEGISPAVRKVVDYLHTHYKEQIGLSDAAEAAGLNSAYLSYLFKQEMGTGFSGYLLDLRLECAKKLLAGTNDKVKDVAAGSGFNDYHYFSKAFKKQVGVSPADYRRQNQDI